MLRACNLHAGDVVRGGEQQVFQLQIPVHYAPANACTGASYDGHKQVQLHSTAMFPQATRKRWLHHVKIQVCALSRKPFLLCCLLLPCLLPVYIECMLATHQSSSFTQRAKGHVLLRACSKVMSSLGMPHCT